MVEVNAGNIHFVVSMNVYGIETNTVEADGFVNDPIAFFMEVIEAWQDGIGELNDVRIGLGYIDEHIRCRKVDD